MSDSNDHLKAKLDGALTAEQKEAYDILVDRIDDVGQSHDDVITAIPGISFFSGVLGKGTNLAGFLFCGHVMNTFKGYGEVFYILVMEGYEPPVAW